MSEALIRTVKLGLIGDNIARSQSPRLHELAGQLMGRPVTYDRLVPPALGLDFDAVFDRAMADGYRGLNITYPYKERVVPRLQLTSRRSRGSAHAIRCSSSQTGRAGSTRIGQGSRRPTSPPSEPPIRDRSA